MEEENYLSKLTDMLSKIEISSKDDIYEYDMGVKEIEKVLFTKKVEQKKLFFCGNGGSAGIAMHMSADFLKNGGFRVLSLYNQSTLTCLGNDFEYESIFAKQIKMLADEGDVLFAISSSGNSQNIINAINEMKKKHATIVTLTGFKKNNFIKELGDYNIYVPIEHYGIVESIHNIILQQIVDEVVEKDGIAIK